jgi:hypothetical protein
MAVGTAHAEMPGYDVARSKALAAAIAPVIEGARMMEVIVALTALLIAALDDGDHRTGPFFTRH